MHFLEGTGCQPDIHASAEGRCGWRGERTVRCKKDAAGWFSDDKRWRKWPGKEPVSSRAHVHGCKWWTKLASEWTRGNTGECPFAMRKWQMTHALIHSFVSKHFCLDGNFNIERNDGSRAICHGVDTFRCTALLGIWKSALVCCVDEDDSEKAQRNSLGEIKLWSWCTMNLSNHPHLSAVHWWADAACRSCQKKLKCCARKTIISLDFCNPSGSSIHEVYCRWHSVIREPCKGSRQPREQWLHFVSATFVLTVVLLVP